MRNIALNLVGPLCGVIVAASASGLFFTATLI